MQVTLLFVELNLESARLAREVEAQIKSALARLPAVIQKDVLERVAVDVLAALVNANGKAKTATAVSVAPKVATDDEQTHWEKILAYCQSQTNPNAKFRTAELTEALLPEKLKEDAAVALSTIYTAVKRRSLGFSRDPYFVWLKKGTFRLATAEERTKAKEAKEAKV